MDNKLLIPTVRQTVIRNFFELDNEALATAVAKAAPKLTSDNAIFIRNALKKEKRSVSVAELRIYEAMLSKRRKHTDGATVTELETDRIAIKESYADLMQKAAVIYGKHKNGLTLSEAARVSNEYMKRIGRDDYTSVVAPRESLDPNKVTITCGRSAISFVPDNSKEFIDKEALKPLANTAIALLLPAEGAEKDYESEIKKFFKLPLCRGQIKISNHGIIGALCDITNGFVADPSALAEGTDEQINALVYEYSGKYLLFFSAEKKEALSKLADKHSLVFRYFAKTASDGRIICVGKSSVRFNIPLSLVKTLKNSNRQETASVYSEIGSAEYILPKAIKKRTSNVISDGTLVLANNRVIAAKYFRGNTGCYENAVNTAVDLLLELAAYGVNRRAVAFACQYEMPALESDSESLGEDLSLILGLYRVTMELASPTSYSDIRYTAKDRGMLCSAYAMRPKETVGRSFTSAGNKICLLSIAESSDGSVSFNELRRVCDKFYDLVRKGLVLSSVAVTGSATDALDSMSGELTYTLSEGSDYLKDGSFKGILFEVSDAKKLRSVAEVTKKPTSDAENG